MKRCAGTVGSIGAYTLKDRASFKEYSMTEVVCFLKIGEP